MTDQEILTKATTQAIDGGWNPLDFRDELDKRYKYLKVLSLEYFDNSILMFYEIGKGSTVYRGDVRIGESDYDVIFNHDFAKALWGDNDKDRKVIIGETDWKKWPLLWQFHLQQMVIANDPIQYLGENLD